jgi:arylsulfatase A-like enzyme
MIFTATPLRDMGCHLSLSVAWLFISAAVATAIPLPKPNVVVILTDDQGYGELGVMGNRVVRTPAIDRLAGQSVSLTDFSVMPVCSPTRAGLMTGRYHYRTGVTDTWMGRSLMGPEETTIAEMLGGAGYRTGIFGKWHLGDNYPYRAMDQGFQESLVLNGGGLGQPSDLPDAADPQGAYFNPFLLHKGKRVRGEGYVSDVITDAAIDFIGKERREPFFVYLAFNAPHTPLQVPSKYLKNYPPEVFAPDQFPSAGNPMPTKHNALDLARVYGMIENIDENIGRLLTKLDELGLAENTIVAFFSDNGCQQHHGYNAGLRDWKGSPYEGGIRQFCFLRWPAGLEAGRRVTQPSAHIDLAPTLLDLCGVAKPEKVKFDGTSLAPLMRGQTPDWPDRKLFFQWHRGDVPGRYRNCAVRSQDWKLVQRQGGGETWDGRLEFQLFHLAKDPYEQHDLAADQPGKVAELKQAYDKWFDEVMAERNGHEPARIFVGTVHENPVLLTRLDWRGPNASWRPGAVGYWDLQVEKAGRYTVTVRFDAAKADGSARLVYGDISLCRPVKTGERQCVFQDVRLPVGPGRLQPTLEFGSKTLGINYAEIRLDD